MFVSAAKDRVLAIIAGILSPYVGATMAGASVRGISQRLGLDQPRLDRNQVGLLLEALGPGLDVYIGKDKARIVVLDIWKALDSLDPTHGPGSRG